MIGLRVLSGLLFLGCGPAPATEHVTVAAPVLTCNCPIAPVVALPAPRTAELDALAQHRVELARKRIPLLRARYEHGTATSAELLAAYRDLAVAARDSGLRGEALRGPLAEYRDAMVQARDLIRSRVAAAMESEDATTHVEFQLAEAEYWLAEAKAQR